MVISRIRYLLYTCGIKHLTFRVKDYSKLYLYGMYSCLYRDYINVNCYISDISIPDSYKNGYVLSSMYDIPINIDKSSYIGKASVYTYNFMPYSYLILELNSKAYKSEAICATPLNLKEGAIELW